MLENIAQHYSDQLELSRHSKLSKVSSTVQIDPLIQSLKKN